MSEPVFRRESVTHAHTIEAIGWLSAELAGRADAWNDNAPDWFPEPPEWLELWDRALAVTADSAGKRV